MEGQGAFQGHGICMAPRSMVIASRRGASSSTYGDFSRCELCMGEEDTWRHSLFAGHVWALVDESLTEHIRMNRYPDAKEWLFHMLEINLGKPRAGPDFGPNL